MRQSLSEILKSGNEEEINLHTKDFFLAKPPFRSAMIQSVIQGKTIRIEIALLKNQAIPVLLIFGKEDNLIQVNYPG